MIKIRIYVKREVDKNQELLSLESLFDKTTKIYPDLWIKIRNNDKNIATDRYILCFCERCQKIYLNED